MKKANINLTPEEVILKMACRATRHALTKSRNSLQPLMNLISSHRLM